MKITTNNNTVNLLSKAKQSKAKQSKAKQSKAKQSKAKQSHNCLLNNNFKFYIFQFLKAFKFLSVSILLHNLVKPFLTSINFDSLSRKIKNPCLVIKKFYSKGVCKMKHTKNILKSLLITVMALSLLSVSCSKDEGGTKAPTNPTIQKISATQLTTALKELGELGDTQTTAINFGLMTDPKDGSASITKASTEDKSLQKVKDAITTVFETPLIPVSVKLTLDSAAQVGNTTALKATIVITANSGFEFDETITKPASGEIKYTYDASGNSATLILNITPAAAWE